jgi:uncharacterized membrane protein YozB (DUF420 family)
MSSGILGTRAGLVADVNLILQITLLVALCVGALQARRGRTDAHRRLMTAVVIANAAAIVFVMNPSFFRSVPLALQDTGSRRSLIMWAHMVVGLLAELLGVYVVIRGNTAPSSWPNMKRTMMITWLLWIAATLGGIVLYVVWYT